MLLAKFYTAYTNLLSVSMIFFGKSFTFRTKTNPKTQHCCSQSFQVITKNCGQTEHCCPQSFGLVSRKSTQTLRFNIAFTKVFPSSYKIW